MKISRLRIFNFRSIKELSLDLSDTTVLVGQNNSGKTAIVDAVRIALTRRWGSRGTGFTENDVHKPNAEDDPRLLPPVTIELEFEEPQIGAWDDDMVAALEDILGFTPDGRNLLVLRVVWAWDEELLKFDPVWQFLNAEGEPLGDRRRSINLTSFFNYVPLFWLGPLRDATSEFAPRSGHWGQLLKGVQIPNDLEKEVMSTLEALDEKISAADPKLGAIAEVIGSATKVAIGEGPGAARLNTLPMAIEEMIERTGVVLRNEKDRPWMPLGQHGQGLQSLSVIFLFQAAALQQLKEEELTGVEPIFAIEEPEAHLHPHAARTLWERTSELPGQQLLTTHSPYYVQHVPIRELRLVRMLSGETTVVGVRESIVSELPWNDALNGFMNGPGGFLFEQDKGSGRLAATSWFDESMLEKLKLCFPDAGAGVLAQLDELHHQSRVMPSKKDEEEIGYHGRRVRGEAFFARRWLLLEGLSDCLLIDAVARGLGFPLDTHGITSIDFSQHGSAGIYPTLAEALGIPWTMVVDGDDQGDQYKENILARGFTVDDIDGRFLQLDDSNDLEAALMSLGHVDLLREILIELPINTAKTCDETELLNLLRNNKVQYASKLAKHVESDPKLAKVMPKQFVEAVEMLMAEFA